LPLSTSDMTSIANAAARTAGGMARSAEQQYFAGLAGQAGIVNSVNMSYIPGVSFNAMSNVRSMGTLAGGSTPASIWDTARQNTIAGGSGLIDAFNKPGGFAGISNELGYNQAMSLARQAGKASSQNNPGILGDLGIGPSVKNPFGTSKREAGLTNKGNQQIEQVSPVYTWEYVAPTGTYSQGKGLEGRTSGFRMDDQNMKYGMNEGELESGKGKVSILGGTGGNNEELLKTTKAERS